MARTLTIHIKPVGDALEDFRRTFMALEAGGKVTPQKGIYFASVEAVRTLLTPTRLALLRAIRARHPGSVYELAGQLKRDLKNVQQDLRLLEEYGLVRLTKSRRVGKRRVKVPRAPFDAIALKIAI